MSMENHGGMMPTEINPLFFYQSSQEMLPADPSGSKEEERVKGMINLVLRSIFCSYLEVIFNIP
jgi:hypothetical protein